MPFWSGDDGVGSETQYLLHIRSKNIIFLLQPNGYEWKDPTEIGRQEGSGEIREAHEIQARRHGKIFLKEQAESQMPKGRGGKAAE